MSSSSECPRKKSRGPQKAPGDEAPFSKTTLTDRVDIVVEETTSPSYNLAAA